MAQSTEHRQADRETCTILDEEIRRLPEKQQAAIVLCLVQGKTHEDAAMELGCPLGTIKSRVATGRAKLARRLSRRGMAPSIALATMLISDSLLARSIPPELARRTLDAATRLAISRSIRGAAVAASVQNLAEGVLSTMRFARVKSIVIGLAVVGILIVGSTALVLARTGREHGQAPVAPVQEVAVSTSAPKFDLYGDPLPSGAVTRFGTIRHRQESRIYRIAFSRDDKLIVTDGDDSQLRVWDARDGKSIRRIPAGIDALSTFALTSDGKTVATAGVQLVPGKGLVREVVFHELATGRELSRSSWVENLPLPKTALDPDRRLLVTGLDGALQMTSVTTGAPTSRVKLENERVRSLSFSADRIRLGVATSRNDKPAGPSRHFRVFDTTNPSDLRPIASFDIDCDHVRFSPDGNMIAAADLMALVFIDVPSGKSQRIEHTFVEDLAFSADGKRIAGIRTPRDKLVLWSPIARKYIDLLNAPWLLAGQIAFSFDGRSIAANGGPNVLHLWDVVPGANGSEQPARMKIA